MNFAILIWPTPISEISCSLAVWCWSSKFWIHI